MSQMTIEQALDLGIKHHEGGRAEAAENIYRQILTQIPDQPEAKHLLGVLAQQAGRHEISTALIKEAIASKPNFPEAYSNLANSLNALGCRDEAVAAYRRAIELSPNFAAAYNNLANVLSDQGKTDEALKAYRRAVTLDPNYAEAHSNLGKTLIDLGLRDEAALSFRRALSLNPANAAALVQLAKILGTSGHLDEAIASLRRAGELLPASPEIWANLGHLLIEKGEVDNAIVAYRKADAIKPRAPEVLSSLGNASRMKGHLNEAIDFFQEAIAVRPQFPEAFANLAVVLMGVKRIDDAVAACRQAIALNPGLAEAYATLGTALTQQGKMEEAIRAMQRAVEIRPNFPEAYNNFGDTLSQNERFEESIAAFRQAIALKPDLAESHSGLGIVLLTTGDLQHGWSEYEWRWKCKDHHGFRNFSQPRWDGRPLNGSTILLHVEQGFGDALQFVRYVPRVADRGGRVIIGCYPELQDLLQSVAPSSTEHPGTSFDVHCPLVSLPLIFQTTEETIPDRVPYLHADPAKVAKWKARIDGLAKPTKIDGGAPVNVGVVWAGNPNHKNDHNRSMAFSTLATIGTIAGVRLFSLQKGPASAQAIGTAPAMAWVDWTAELVNFTDTAALVANLDLVITVDTAVAHLAGALGRPTWLMLPLTPDWRWMLKREDSPWYPTMRLFRQTSRGDWSSVVQRIRHELSVWVDLGSIL